MGESYIREYIVILHKDDDKIKVSYSEDSVFCAEGDYGHGDDVERVGKRISMKDVFDLCVNKKEFITHNNKELIKQKEIEIAKQSAEKAELEKTIRGLRKQLNTIKNSIDIVKSL